MDSLEKRQIMKKITLFIIFLMTFTTFSVEGTKTPASKAELARARAICLAEITIGRDISMLGIELIQGNDKEKARLRQAIENKATLLGVKLDPKPSTIMCLNDWSPAQPKWNNQIYDHMADNDKTEGDFLTSVVRQMTKTVSPPIPKRGTAKVLPLAINMRLYAIGWNCGLIYQSNAIAFISNGKGNCSKKVIEGNARGAKLILEILDGDKDFKAFFQNDSSFKSVAKALIAVKTNKESVAVAKLIAAWPEKFIQTSLLPN
jgi:hypothetical protein